MIINAYQCQTCGAQHSTTIFTVDLKQARMVWMPPFQHFGACPPRYARWYRSGMEIRKEHDLNHIEMTCSLR